MVFSGVVWSTSRLHAKTVKYGYCLSIVTIALRRTLAGHFFTFADVAATTYPTLSARYRSRIHLARHLARPSAADMT